MPNQWCLCVLYVYPFAEMCVYLAGHCVSHSNKECVPVCPLYFGMSHVWTDHVRPAATLARAHCCCDCRTLVSYAVGRIFHSGMIYVWSMLRSFYYLNNIMYALAIMQIGVKCILTNDRYGPYGRVNDLCNFVSIEAVPTFEEMDTG